VCKMPSQPPEPLDEPMQDAPTNGIAEPAAQEIIAEIDDKQCIRTVGTRYSPTILILIRLLQVGPTSLTAATFQFEGEDHTLGNALRYIIMKKFVSWQWSLGLLLTLTSSPEVELCGYSIPHPAEAKMNLRIQTYGGSLLRCLKEHKAKGNVHRWHDCL
jgi:DNA-directed RNA polymerase subunit L